MLDLEATCDDQRSIPRKEMEIIEIGAVLLDPASWRIREEFNAFVKPVRNPELTPFCTRLTSITQADADQASGFVDVVTWLQDWLQPFRLTAWGSWGNYDRRQIEQDAGFHGIGFPIAAPHFNLKDRFAKRLKLPRRPGLSKALDIAGLAFKGTHHRAIDDARNIARLMPMMYGTGPTTRPP